MSRLNMALAMVVAFGLAACQQATATKTRTTPVAFNAAGLPVPEPLAKPGILSVSGAYQHQYTKFILPASSGAFTRTGLFQYDRNGMDVSANYAAESPAGKVLASVYIYPATLMAPDAGPYELEDWRLCREVFENAQKAAQELYVKPWLIETSAASDVARNKMGWHALFEAEARRKEAGGEAFAAADGPLTSEIYVYCSSVPLVPHDSSGGLVGSDNFWHVKYRITYPKRMSAKDLIDQLMRSVPDMK